MIFDFNAAGNIAEGSLYFLESLIINDEKQIKILLEIIMKKVKKSWLKLREIIAAKPK